MGFVVGESFADIDVLVKIGHVVVEEERDGVAEVVDKAGDGDIEAGVGAVDKSDHNILVISLSLTSRPH